MDDIKNELKSIVHTLNNVLTSIYTYAEPALQDESLKKEALEKILKSSEELENELKRLKKILDKMD